MAYEPTNWKSSDVVTSAKLNKLENGVQDASRGGVLVVRGDPTTQTLDKTWQEIRDSVFAVLKDYREGAIIPLTDVWTEDGDYGVLFYQSGDANPNLTFLTDSADGYPHYTGDPS